MHKFFITNDLGGGGTNVSRLYDYIELFDLEHIGMLLNYYYLRGYSKPVFDVPLIRQITNYQDVSDFVAYCRTYFSSRRETSSAFSAKQTKSKIRGFILDNGCGNFLRNTLSENNSHTEINSYIKPFLDFAEKLDFDLSVSLDLAMKYTYKANEVDNPAFMSKWQQLSSDNKINLTLLSDALEVIKKENYTHKILAPLHGYNYASFSQYYDEIIQLEEKYCTKFGGFALGGIADTRRLDDKLWQMPSGIKNKKYKKSAYICYNLIKAIRNKTDRHIHVLGAGNIYTLPFLIYAGADSSDCHSAWRRSSDGGIDKAKIMIPLFDKNFNFINDKNCLEFVKIGELNKNEYNLNCGLSISQIKNLLNSCNKEDFYFGEIIMFFEAILQYNILIDYIENNPHDFLDKLTKTPDKTLNENYKSIISILNL